MVNLEKKGSSLNLTKSNYTNKRNEFFIRDKLHWFHILQNMVGKTLLFS